MSEHLKKRLTKHRLSLCMSIIWAIMGYLLFAFVITPFFFGSIVVMWRSDWRSIAPLYAGLACSLLTVSCFMASARRFPYSNKYEVLLSFVFVVNALLLIYLAIARYFYSTTILCCFILFQSVWLGMEVFYRAKFVQYFFAIFPASIKLASTDFPGYKMDFIYSRQEMECGKVDAVIVEDESALDKEWAKLLEDCRSANIPIIPLASFLENVWGRALLADAQDILVMTSVYSSWYLLIKKISDKVLALFGLTLLLPVIGGVAIALKWTSGNPVFFKQKRIGVNDRVFMMYKFRTMQCHANAPDSISATPTITPLGRFLRKYHLDELPQLYNVLKGDMTFVGPRPETPELTAYYRRTIPCYHLRTKIEQGVVGWALIHQGNVAGVDDTTIKVSYDIYYMKRATIFLDAYIILKSIWLVIFGIERVKSPHSFGLFSNK